MFVKNMDKAIETINRTSSQRAGFMWYLCTMTILADKQLADEDRKAAVAKLLTLDCDHKLTGYK
jgi:hypothetical protein